MISSPLLPVRSFPQTLFRSTPFIVRQSKIKLRYTKALRGSSTVPVESFFVVLGNPQFDTNSPGNSSRKDFRRTQLLQTTIELPSGSPLRPRPPDTLLQADMLLLLPPALPPT